MPSWGLLANPGFEDRRLKAVYFFAGNWRFGSNEVWSDPYYTVPVTRNDHTYTVHPANDQHLKWSEQKANRDFALDAIVDAGANIVVMSSWGPASANRWSFYAPMQTSAGACDELFDAAIGRPLRIMPAIESANGTSGGQSSSYHFSDDFPGPAGNPAPALVEQLVDLVNRYLLHPRDRRWPTLWARMYDQTGKPRFAVNILHVASRHLAEDADAEFAAGLGAVADRVHQLTEIEIGFTLDLVPAARSFQIGDDRGWVPWLKILGDGRAAGGSRITPTWSNPDHLDLFMIDAHGAVLSTWWDKSEPAGYRPGGWFAIHPETQFVPGGHVTAIRLADGRIDLFAVDRDGIVRSIWWDRREAGYRAAGWFAVHPETRFPPGAPVGASWSNKGHLDLFATDLSGAVRSIFWDTSDPSGYRAEGWFAIHPQTVFQPGAWVTVKHRGEEHLDLFAADQAGIVRTISWDSGDGYRPAGWLAIHPSARTTPGAPITALWADDQHLDLFMTGVDGVVRSVWWDAREPEGYRPQGWFTIGSDVLSLPGAPVEALWTDDSGRLHLFIADAQGRVVEAVWKDNDDPNKSWTGWMSIWPQLRTTGGGAVTAAHARGVHIDAFVVDTEGIPHTAWQDTLHDTYVARPEQLGRLLREQPSMLGVQGFIPEIWLGGSTDLERVLNKLKYWMGWLTQGVPVIMDVSPGYDAHLVFKDSPFYGFTEVWRRLLAAFWNPAYSGMAYNAWNGYTEGFAGMPLKEAGERDSMWLRDLFAKF